MYAIRLLLKVPRRFTSPVVLFGVDSVAHAVAHYVDTHHREPQDSRWEHPTPPVKPNYSRVIYGVEHVAP